MKRILVWLAVLVVVVLVAAGAAGWWAWRQVERPYRGFPGDAAMVVVEPGTASVHILDLLEERGVIADARLARLYMKLALGDPPLQAGEYRFEGAQPLPAVLAKLVEGDVVDHAVTIVEGLTLEETAEALADADFGDLDAFLAAMRDPAPIADLDPEATDLEGYLFPSTYRFRRGTTEQEVVATMVATFRRAWESEIVPLLADGALVIGDQGGQEGGELDGGASGAPDDEGESGAAGEPGVGEDAGEGARTAAGAPADAGAAEPPAGAAEVEDAAGAEPPAVPPGATPPDEPVRPPSRVRPRLTVRELVTLASLVEKEAKIEAERPQIAAVYANRLERGMGLYADPTVIYALKQAGRWDGNIRREDLRMDSPYNTYRHAGLPPGPIASPGLASLEAAARPADFDALYFVSRNDGSHVFAETLAEHNRNVDRWQRQYWREQRRRQSAQPRTDERQVERE
ncbi:MAG TPA: endolytic transglycosylase MltG [Thermoanaerobaculia bacterium]